jgi:hypothetical protein
VCVCVPDDDHVVDLPGRAQIVAALRACVQDARVQVEGMQVIRNLVWGKAEEQNSVAAAGGIEAIIAGMQAHRENVDVQEMGYGLVRMWCLL